MEDLGFAMLLIVGILCAPSRPDDTLKSRLSSLKGWLDRQ